MTQRLATAARCLAAAQTTGRGPYSAATAIGSRSLAE
jgi:hypothetical protein